MYVWELISASINEHDVLLSDPLSLEVCDSLEVLSCFGLVQGLLGLVRRFDWAYTTTFGETGFLCV